MNRKLVDIGTKYTFMFRYSASVPCQPLQDQIYHLLQMMITFLKHMVKLYASCRVLCCRSFRQFCRRFRQFFHHVGFYVVEDFVNYFIMQGFMLQKISSILSSFITIVLYFETIVVRCFSSYTTNGQHLLRSTVIYFCFNMRGKLILISFRSFYSSYFIQIIGNLYIFINCVYM